MHQISVPALALSILTASVSPAADLTPYQLDSIATENSFSIYLIPSPHGLDWSSPSTLVSRTLRNSFTEMGYRVKDPSFHHSSPEHGSNDGYWVSVPNHPIGHISIGIRCKGEKEIFTGMTSGDDLEAPSDLFLNGYGLGILFKTQQGRLQTAKEVAREIHQRRSRMGRIAEFRVMMKEGHCRTLKNYLHQYIERGLDRRYGSLVDRPLRGDGAGCAAFGLSFLKVLSVIPVLDENIPADHFSQAWRRRLHISESFIGDGRRAADVGVYGLLKRDHPWVIANQPFRTLTFWDPELFYRWTLEAWAGNKRVPYRMTPMTDGYMKGVAVDYTEHPISILPIWEFTPMNVAPRTPEQIRLQEKAHEIDRKLREKGIW